MHDRRLSTVEIRESSRCVDDDPEKKASRCFPLISADDVPERALGHELRDDLHDVSAIHRLVDGHSHDHDDVGVVQFRHHRHLAHKAVDRTKHLGRLNDAHDLHGHLAREVSATMYFTKSTTTQKPIFDELDLLMIELPAFPRGSHRGRFLSIETRVEHEAGEQQGDENDCDHAPEPVGGFFARNLIAEGRFGIDPVICGTPNAQGVSADRALSGHNHAHTGVAFGAAIRLAGRLAIRYPDG